MAQLADHWRDKVVFAYIDEPPFARPRSNGEAVGCDVDLAMTVLRAIGVRTVETKVTTFAELLPGIAAGRWTMNVPLFVTPQRAALVAFSRPVWALHDGLIVPAGNPKRLDGYRAIAEAQRGHRPGATRHRPALRRPRGTHQRISNAAGCHRGAPRRGDRCVRQHGTRQSNVRPRMPQRCVARGRCSGRFGVHRGTGGRVFVCVGPCGPSRTLRRTPPRISRQPGAPKADGTTRTVRAGNRPGRHDGRSRFAIGRKETT
jgi:Bacterial extracellular solute-binding proteins, family 3